MEYFLTNQNLLGYNTTDKESIVFYLSKLDFIFLDTETTGLCPHVNTPILLLIGDDVNQYAIDIRTNLKDVIYILNALKDKTFVAHNAKFDDKMLLSLGINLYNWICLMNMSLVLYCGIKYYKNEPFKHSLDAALKRHLDVVISKNIRSSFINKHENSLFTKQELNYAIGDIKYLPALLKRFIELSTKFKLDYILNPYNYNLEGKFVHILSLMEYQGIGFCQNQWLLNSKEIHKHLKSLEAQLKDEVNTLRVIFKGLPRKKYNFSSTKDIYMIFSVTGELHNLPEREDLDEFIKKKEDKLRKKQKEKAEVSIGTKKNNKIIGHLPTLFNIEEIEVAVTATEEEKYSLGEAQLNEFLETNSDSPLYDFVQLLLEYRTVDKLVSTYGESFTSNVNTITDKIHSNYSQCRTLTGRLSSSKPNMQNIPQTNKLRNCFIPEEGYFFMIIDYDRQELFILASQSKDKTLLASINDGLDLHSHLATGSYRIINKDSKFIVSKTKNKECRNAHKPVLFGWIYGAGAYRVAKTLNITKNVASKVVSKLEELLVGAKNYLNKVRSKALKDKFVRDGSKSNRRRFFNSKVQEHSLKKQAGNYKMQSTGASMVKEAMVETEVQLLKPLRSTYPHIGAVMQVHDEATYQLPIELKETLPNEIYRVWTSVGNTYLDGINIDAEYEISNFWKK